MARAARRPSWRLIERLRYRSHSGRVIRRHRALRKLDFERASIAHPLLLTGACYAVLWATLDTITRAWAAVMAFWLSRLEIDAPIAWRERELAGVIHYSVPFPELAATLPGASTLYVTLVVCLILMALAYILSRPRALPLGYLVWAGCLVELAACAMFALAPSRFPHTVATHVANGLEYVVVLLLFVPVLLAVAYFVFDHRLSRKAFGAAMILLALVLVAPFQYLLHIVAIEVLTIVAMPVLFVLFGLLFDVAVFVALYAWAVSWEP